MRKSAFLGAAVATWFFACGPAAAMSSCHESPFNLRSGFVGSSQGWVKGGDSCAMGVSSGAAGLLELATAPKHGKVDFATNGARSWRYMPERGYKGADQYMIGFKFSDSRGQEIYLTVDMDVR